MPLEDIWNKSLSKVEQKVGSSVFELWFKPIKMVQVKDQTVVLEIPNRFYKEWIDDTYPNLIKDSLETVMGFPITLKYKVEEQQDSSQKKNIEKLEQKRIKLANKGIYLNPKFTFGHFVKG